MEAQIRNDLRNKRIDVYSQLFIHMRKLAILSNRKNLNYYELKKIHIQFTLWYYTKQGGLLMSKHSQQAFIDFQKTLKHVLASTNEQEKNNSTDNEKKITNENYIVKFLSFKLRIALIADVDVNATILLRYNEKKKINEEAMKAYSKLFIDEKEKEQFEEAVKDYRDYLK